MKIVNSTENYTTLNTNKFTANNVIANLLVSNNLSIVENSFLNGNLTVNQNLGVLGGTFSSYNILKGPDTYEATVSDGGKHQLLSNSSGVEWTYYLPSIESLNEVAIELSFTVATSPNNSIFIEVAPGSSDTIDGRLLGADGGNAHFVSTGTMSIFTTAIEGDFVILKSDVVNNKWRIYGGLTTTTGVISPSEKIYTDVKMILIQNYIY